MELMVQAIAISGPLMAASFGPKRSIKRPATGTARNVSMAMPIAKVH